MSRRRVFVVGRAGLRRFPTVRLTSPLPPARPGCGCAGCELARFRAELVGAIAARLDEVAR